MRTDIPAAITDEMALNHFNPATKVYAQPYYPYWTCATTLVSSVNNPIGHDAKYVNGHLLRVRSGSKGDGYADDILLPHPLDAGPHTVTDGIFNPTSPTAVYVRGIMAGTSLSGEVKVHGASAYRSDDWDTFTLNGNNKVWGTRSTIFITVTSVDLPKYVTNGDRVAVGDELQHDFAEDGKIYFANITGDDLEDPDTWENYWVRLGTFTNAQPPRWMGDPPLAQPAQCAIAADENGNIQLFYFERSPTYRLKVMESSDWGQNWTGPTTVYDVAISNKAMQVAACQLNEVFFTDYIVVAPKPQGAPNPDVYGTVIYRATKSGGTWSTTTTWPLKGRWLFQKSERDSTIWGSPVWSCISVVNRPDGRALIAVGGVLQDALAEDGDQQGIYAFIYDRTANLWWPGPTISLADYNDGSWFFDMEVRASIVNSQVWLTWMLEDEPTDINQNTEWTIVPRTRELVYSRSLTGDNFTEPQCITTDARVAGSGPIFLIGTKLYMVSWYHVYTADATFPVLGSSAAKTDISGQVNAWSVQQTGRSPDMQIALRVNDPDNFDVEPGDMISIEAGAVVSGTPQTVQIARGIMDTFDPSLSVQDVQYGGPASVLVAKPLLDIRSRNNYDLFPQATTFVEPVDMGKLAIETGLFEIKNAPAWAVSAGLGSRNFIDTSTWPDVGGDWHQMAFITHPRTLNGQIEASVRLGVFNEWQTTKTVSRTVGSDQVSFHIVNGHNNEYHWNSVSGWFSDNWDAVGLVARAYAAKRVYVYAWEPNLPAWNDRAQGDKTKNNINLNGHTVGTNALLLYICDFGDDGWQYWSVLEVCPSATHGLTVGNIAHLKMVCHYGQIHCFYRSNSTTEWSLAFSHSDAATFGAGRFGVYGRGMNCVENAAGIAAGITNFRNHAYLWDVKIAGEDKAITMEDVLKDYAWKAGVEIDTEAKIYEASRSPAGTYMYTTGGYDPLMDANITFAAGETGFVLRATNANNGVFLGVTPGAIGTGKLTLTVKVGGTPTVVARAPTWFTIPTGVSLPVRVYAEGFWYSVWIGNLLLGSIYYDLWKGGVLVGIYGNSTFANVRMAELGEVPAFATLDSNQSILDGIIYFLAKRRIRRFLTWDGKLRLSYFETRDQASPNEDRMVRNQVRKAGRYISHCRVNGARGWAEYKSSYLLTTRGRTFQEVDMPDIEGRDKMYLEARMIVRESAELALQSNFSGPPDLTLEPEDAVEITVTKQGISGDFVVDDITLTFQGGKLTQTIGTRQVYQE